MLLHDSLKLMSGFQSKHHLSDKVISGVMKLVKHHLPQPHNYPSSAFQLNNTLPQADLWTKVYFCHLCNITLNETFKCSVCRITFEQKLLEKSNNYFVVFDLRKQLEMILTCAKVKSVLSAKLLAYQNGGGEGGNGVMLKQLRDDAFDITCTLNSDGVQLFESSNNSIWPFLISVNELPYRLRKQFILLGGIWLCGRKLNMKLFLAPIVEMLNDIYMKPITWTAENGEVIKSRLISPVCSVDSPARCKMQGLIQFNGMHGCSWCDHPGKRVPKGRGFARVYPFQGFHPHGRDNLQFKQDLLARKFSTGIKYTSPLNYLRQFDIVWGFTVDAMHCVMLGVVRTFTFMWLDNFGASYYISLKDVESRISNVFVPAGVSRSMRSLNYRKQWKASEWQTWLYLSILLLRGILPRKYLNHFRLLVEAIHALCSQGLSVDEISTVENKLISFVQKVKLLYGEEYCTYNVHILLHLTNCYKRWGSLIGFSTFQFESFNGELLSKVTSSKGILSQITRRFISTLRCKVDDIDHARFTDVIGFRYTPKYSVESPRLVKFISADLRCELNRFCKVKSICEGKSAYINYIFYNTSSCKSLKRIDNVFYLNGSSVGIIDKLYAVECCCGIDCECEKFFIQYRAADVENSKRLSFCKYREVESVLGNSKLVPFSSVIPVKYYTYIYDDFEYFVTIPNCEEIE